MKKILVILILSISTFIVYSQNTALDNTTGVSRAAESTGRMILREIAVTSFEDPTTWDVSIPVDRGNVKIQRIVGSPTEKDPIRLEEQINSYTPSDRYVLGIRTEFYSRAITNISIKSKREIYLPGIVKVISVWVAGRGKLHELSIILRDMNGQVKKIPMGTLNFIGWKKLEITIPGDMPQDDISGSLHGLYVIGFMVDTHFEDTVGRYYMYFDDLRVISDVIDEVIKDSSRTGDIGDGW